MLTRVLGVLFLLFCLSAPTVGSNSEFDDAVAKAADISGCWIATLNHEQAAMFTPDSISDMILSIHTRIRRLGDQLEQAFDARLEVGFDAGLESPIYDRMLLGHAVETGGNQLELSGIRFPLADPEMGRGEVKLTITQIRRRRP